MLNFRTKSATKIPLKPHYRISLFRLTLRGRLHRIEQSGVASTKAEQSRNQKRNGNSVTKKKQATEKKNYCCEKVSNELLGGVTLVFQAEHRPHFMRGYKTKTFS